MNITFYFFKCVIFVEVLNVNDMEEMLLENGFVHGKYPKEYTRSTWTIRLDALLIEVFDDMSPEGTGYYFSGESSYANLENILEDINSMDEFGHIL